MAHCPNLDQATVRLNTRIRPITGICAVIALAMPAMIAAEPAWEDRLAGTFSGRLKEIRREVVELTEKLDELPGIPIDDQGGTGGFSSTHSLAAPQRGKLHAVEIDWKEPAMVDLVALVPARRYDARGLDAHFGMPDRFTVELMDAEGKSIRVLANERNARAHPVRRGPPFGYRVSPPWAAAGMRVIAE